MMVHILIINFNNLQYTINCLKSIQSSTYKEWQIHLLDNNSQEPELREIKNQFKDSRIYYYQSSKNLGFAGGNNFLLESILPHSKPTDLVLFLNNDTTIDKNLLKIFKSASNEYPILAARTMKMDDHLQIDNLGITISKSFLARNRKTEKEEFFGPCGCCAAFTAKSLTQIKEQTLDYFDSDYFCYGEDTDLAWRAKLIGLSSIYLPDALCYHKGGATSGQHFNKFVMYHTLRNNLYNMTKNATKKQLLLQLPHIIIFNLALIFRYLPTNKFPTLLNVYKDYFKHLKTLIKKRKVIQKTACTY